MQNYELHIGKVSNLDLTTSPRHIIKVTEKELSLLKNFTHTKKDKDLNDVYILNNCEFTIVPVLESAEQSHD